MSVELGNASHGKAFSNRYFAPVEKPKEVSDYRDRIDLSEFIEDMKKKYPSKYKRL